MDDPIGAGGADFSERLITVAEGVDLRMLEWRPHESCDAEPILFVAGWVSLVDGWADLLRALAPRHRIVYLETREKHSARLDPAVLEIGQFTVSRLAADLIAAAQSLASEDLDLQRTVLIGSSLGANTILEALKHGRLEVLGAFLVNPNTSFWYPWWAPGVIHLPRVVHRLAKWIVVKYLRRRRVDAERDPAQMRRYEGTVRAADPVRLKLSAQAIHSYQVWPDLETIQVPVALAYASTDTLHGEAEILAIAERLLHPVPVECRTNTAMHGAELVADLDRFIEGCRQPVSRLSHQPAASTLRTIRD